MKTFWKKYKDLSQIYNKNKDKNTNFVLHSDSIPWNKKLHAGSVFFLVMKDILKKYYKIQWENLSDYMMRSYDKTFSDTKKINTTLKTKTQLRKNENRAREIIDNCFFDKHNFVLDEEFSRFSRDVFKQLYTTNKLLLSQKVRPWSFKNASFVDESDVIYKEETIKKYNIKYFIEGKWDALLLSTTHPETIFADVALAVHPKDKRYKKYIGKNILIPIINKPIPIISDETLDSFDDYWIYRITPGHDQFWLEMAKKHHLPLEVFALDDKGFFTNNCGHFQDKSLNDFFDNIIQFLKDISNLDSIELIQEKIAYNKKNNEKLFLMQREVRQINNEYIKDVFLWIIEDQKLVFHNVSKEAIIACLPNLEIDISEFNTPWNLVPIVSQETVGTLLDETKIIEAYKNKWNEEKHLWLTLIILNLIYDKVIPPYFKIETLIEKLFELNYSNIIRGTTYLEQIKEYISQEEYQILNDLFEQVNTNEEIGIWGIIDFLDQSFLVQSQGSLYNISEEKKRLIHYDIWFNDTFLSVCNILYYNNLQYKENFDTINYLKWIYLTSNDKIQNSVKIILTVLLFSKQLIINKLEAHPSLIKDTWEKINGYNSKLQDDKNAYIIKHIWIDSWRLALLLSNKETETDNDYIYSLETSFADHEIHPIISKIWNAYRYIYNSKSEKNIETIISYINNNINTIWDIDKWILYETIEIYNSFAETKWNINGLIQFSHKFKIFVENLTERYLEITKINATEYSSNIAWVVFSMSLPLISVYIPWLAHQLNSILHYEDLNINILNQLHLWTKNYKINIFIEICRKIALLKNNNSIKKHEEIELIIQSGPGLLKFIEGNKELLSSLLNISSLLIINTNQEIPEGYIYDRIIDINIWIKKIGTKKTKAEILQEKINLLDKNKQDLQYHKSLMVKLAQIWNVDKLQTKKQEIEKINTIIENLENEIKILKNK